MKEQVEVFFHSQQPYVHVQEEDLEKYDSGRLGFPNSYFDPEKPTRFTTNITNNMSWLTKLGLME